MCTGIAESNLLKAQKETVVIRDQLLKGRYQCPSLKIGGFQLVKDQEGTSGGEVDENDKESDNPVKRTMFIKEWKIFL